MRNRLSSAIFLSVTICLAIIIVTAVIYFSGDDLTFQGYEDQRKCDEAMLWNVIRAMNQIMHYLHENRDEHIMDTAISNRMVADQLHLMLSNSAAVQRASEDIHAQLKGIMEIAERMVAIYHEGEDVKGEQEFLGVIEKGAFGLWYGSRPIKPHLLQKPDVNAMYDFGWTEHCLKEAHPPKGHSAHSSSSGPEKFNPSLGTQDRSSAKYCNLSEDCWTFITQPGFDDYGITHQMLDFQVAEAYGCFSEKPEIYTPAIIDLIQNTLCTNIFRDARKIERNNFAYMDLFMEQIAQCGMYGFNSFFNRKWITVILSKMSPSGCYDDIEDPPEEHKLIARKDIDPGERYMVPRPKSKEHVRKKRSEKMLAGDCSLHATGLAAEALVVELRFCIEYLDGVK